MKKYYIKNSFIHGSGAFAAKKIRKGERIGEYVGRKISKKESDEIGIAQQKKAEQTKEGAVYIFELNDEFDLDGNVPENDARLINHSCDPNCEAVNEDDHIVFVATKTIELDAEIVYNYGYEFQHFLEHPCKCGSANCCGYIIAEHDRPKLMKLLRNKRKKSVKIL